LKLQSENPVSSLCFRKRVNLWCRYCEATVKREGKVYTCDATTLVPGDIVVLGAVGLCTS
jgi:magnesium-transporting ATPase (P-type)